MNKFSLYVLLVFIYLGMDKGLLQSQSAFPIIHTTKELSMITESYPVNIILVDSFTRGVLVKSYFHVYKLVYGFKSPEILTLQVSSGLFHKYHHALFHCIFNRFDNKLENFTITKPGVGFIDNDRYGLWQKSGDYGQRYWNFNKNYFNLYKELALNEKSINETKYQIIKRHIERNIDYLPKHQKDSQRFKEKISILESFDWSIIKNRLFFARF